MRSTLLIICLFITNSLFSQVVFSENYPDSVNKKRLYSTISSELVFYSAGLSYLSFIWYKDHQRVDFHLYNDSKGYLQMDKWGHAFGAYRESYAAYHALRWSGLDKKKALIFGGPVGLIFQTPIEIFDGLYEGWGFSWSDMAANTFGAGLFTIQEALFEDQVILMKFSYYPSIYPSYHKHLGETPVESFFLDYNAHTYWLSAGLSQITGVKAIPKWINLAFGYSANGMIYEFDNPDYYMGKPFPDLKRYRQYLLSFDVNLSKIETKNRFLQKLFRAFNILKVPFPAIELNNVEGIKFHAFYY